MINKLKDKYVFFDVDGTLSEYRFNDKLYEGGCYDLGCQSLDNLLFGDLFYHARPLKTMQRLINNLDPNKAFILGTIVTNNEINQKYKVCKVKNALRKVFDIQLLIIIILIKKYICLIFNYQNIKF